MKDILAKIISYREARNWSEYQLAEKAGLPQSTISSWYRKNMIPSVASLMKICDAFDITLSQLFSENEELLDLNDEQKLLLAKWATLTAEQRKAILELIDTI